MLRVFVGHDPREQKSFDVATSSARRWGCEVQGLYEDRLRLAGILTRPLDVRGGQAFDLTSGAPQSTRFAVARFATVILAHSGWALFVDGDTLFLRDPHVLVEFMDPNKAVCVVKHQVSSIIDGTKKMDNQAQMWYPRKLWSSVMLFNCDHEANRRLNLTTLNTWPGRDLHAFKWLHDSEIGELPPEFNWLVGMQPKPSSPCIAHYTLGTPELVPNCEHADLWHEALKEAA